MLAMDAVVRTMTMQRRFAQFVLLFELMLGGITPAFSADSPSWTAVEPLATARYGHSATRLADGRVLVAGGTTLCCVLSSAEIFDPATRTWHRTQDMPVGYAGHAAVLLHDGRVLVIGADQQAELFDPRTEMWTLTGRLHARRFGFTATLLTSGKVLVSGGDGGDASTLSAAELYDPATGTWSLTGNLVEAREAHTATLMPDGNVLVAGGVQANPGNIELPLELHTAEIYDAASGQWRLTTPPNRQYLMPGAAALRNGHVVILGDVGDTEQYDPATATWTITATRNVAVQQYAATPLPDGRVLVAGGYDSRTTTFDAGTAIYDGDSGTWTVTAPLITPRRQATATALANGDVLVVGGLGSNDQGAVLASAEIYSSASAPAGTIGPGFTGSWYDPAHSGQGLMIEVLPGNRFLAAWLAFDPAAGRQTWFTGVGTYSGDTATIDNVALPTGGRWGSDFDSASPMLVPWGTLRFTFTDCNHGRVDFTSVAGYGTGSMNLTRLTQPAGLSCGS